jgi:hypothetical protein
MTVAEVLNTVRRGQLTGSTRVRDPKWENAAEVRAGDPANDLYLVSNDNPAFRRPPLPGAFNANDLTFCQPGVTIEG